MTVKRILIDCSDTYIYNLNTGVQRTVHSIVERVGLIQNELGIPVIPVILTKYGYIEIKKFSASDLSNIQKISFRKKAQQFLKSKVKSDEAYNFVQQLWHSYAKIYYPVANTFSNFIRFAINKKTTLHLNKHDLLFIIDAFWQPTYSDNRYFWNLQKHLKNKGGKVGYLIYDIIPITNEEYVNSCFMNVFEKSFKRLIEYSDFLVTISQSEQKIINSYLSSLKANIPVEYFYLGANFPEPKKGELLQSKALAISNKMYFLMVGTIEPRKGHNIVLEAFEYLWKNGFDYCLVIVGKVGWDVDRLYRRILKSKIYNKRLFVFENINDSSLEFLYSKAKALIFASMREGFGLPLVEAIQKRIPVLASDIDVFREIGKDYPIYFNPNDPNDLIEKIKLLGKQLNNKEKTSNCYALNWDDSIKMLCEKLKNYIS